MKRRILAEFASADGVLRAAEKMRARGCPALDAYTPYPLPALNPLLGIRRSRIPAFVLAGGVAGGLIGYAIQWWTATVSYPLDVGGRPLHSAPAFVPITFETIVLFASFTAFGALLYAARLPTLWHPTSEVEGFERATIDRFWLEIDGENPRAVDSLIEPELRDAGALRVLQLEVRE